jgi:hypothetical protein
MQPVRYPHLVELRICNPSGIRIWSNYGYATRPVSAFKDVFTPKIIPSLTHKTNGAMAHNKNEATMCFFYPQNDDCLQLLLSANVSADST